MNTNKQGRKPVYENSFKIALAHEYLTSNLGYGAIASKYGLPGPATVRFFVNWYKRNYAESAGSNVLLPENKLPESVTDKQLSKQLQEANLKIAGLEMLVETAQKELGVDIVKKYGAKQSFK
jgi:transposase-like protein